MWINFTFIIFLGCCILLAMADDCRYEFTVQGDSASLSRCSSLEDEGGRKLSDLEAEMHISRGRVASMAETFETQVTRLGNETNALKDMLNNVQTHVTTLHGSVAMINKIENEVNSLKNLMIYTNDSLSPKFTQLQQKMLDIVHDLQTEMTSQTSTYREVMLEVVQLQKTTRQHSTDIKDLKSKADTLLSMPLRYQRFTEVIEKQVKDKTTGLDGRVSHLEFTTSSNEGKVENLEGSLTAMKNSLPDRENMDDLLSRISAIENWKTRTETEFTDASQISKQLKTLNQSVAFLSEMANTNKDVLKNTNDIFTKKFEGFSEDLENMGRDVQRIERELPYHQNTDTRTRR